MLLMWRARKSVAASYVRLLAQPPPPHGTAGQWLDWLRYQARCILVPPAHPRRPRHRDRPGKIVNDGLPC